MISQSMDPIGSNFVPILTILCNFMAKDLLIEKNGGSKS